MPAEGAALADLASITPLRKRGWRRTPLVFVHGFSSDAASHDGVLSLLARKGYPCWSFDLPGHGSHKSESEAQMRVSRYVQLVAGFIRQRRLRNVALIGHSMGGAVAVGVNAMLPAAVRCLILEAPLNREAFSVNRERLEQLSRIGDDAGRKGLFAGIRRLWGMRKGFEPLFRDIASRATGKKVNWAYESVGDKPTLVVWGARDPVIPPKASIAYIARHASDLRVAVFPAAGHSPHRDEPRAFCAHVLDFLRETARQAKKKAGG